MPASRKALASIALVASIVVAGTSLGLAGPLPGIPGLDLPLPPPPPPQPSPQPEPAPEGPSSPPADVREGPAVPAVCTGGVLEAGGRLQRFADSLKVGETGCLDRGVHKGGVDLRKPSVTLRSFPGRRATINGGQVRISATATRARLKKLRLISDQFSPLIYASRAVITGNEITNRHTAICLHIDRYPGTPVPTGIVIEDNRIHNCGRLPANNHDHGIYIAVARGTIVRDNLIYDNSDRGVQLYPKAHRTRVVGNVIDGNGQGVIFGNSSDHNLVKDNIISNSKLRHNVESTGSSAQANIVRDNCLWSARGGYYGGEPPASGVLPGNHGFVLGPNTIGDPRFKNRVNFRPGPNSPCNGIGPD